MAPHKSVPMKVIVASVKVPTSMPIQSYTCTAHPPFIASHPKMEAQLIAVAVGPYVPYVPESPVTPPHTLMLLFDSVEKQKFEKLLDALQAPPGLGMRAKFGLPQEAGPLR